MSPQRSFVIYINHTDQVVKQTLLEFAEDLGNRAAGFDSVDDVRDNLALIGPKTDVVITQF